MAIDLHQHLWTAGIVAQLRERARPPRLTGWTLQLSGEPDGVIDSEDHDPTARAALDPGVDRFVVGLSAALGLEYVDPEEAALVAKLWHEDARAFNQSDPRWSAWAFTGLVEPDHDALDAALAEDHIVGLQIPATAIVTPNALEQLAPVLDRAQRAGRPVFVHPGAATPVSGTTPTWWPAMVDYVGQLQAAWWAWHAAGPALLPDLRICFVAGAGLAPVLHERATARGAGRLRLDPNVYVETSSLGRQGIDALVRVLGIDNVCRGSDRPYAEPAQHDLGDAAERAISVTNPERLLTGSSQK